LDRILLAAMIVAFAASHDPGLLPREKGMPSAAIGGCRAGFGGFSDPDRIPITFLAHQAWVMTDASYARYFDFSGRRRLLEWVTAAQVSREVNEDGAVFVLRLAGSFASRRWHRRDTACRFRDAPSPRHRHPMGFLSCDRLVGQQVAAKHRTLPLTEAGRERPCADRARTWRFFDGFITRRRSFFAAG